MKSLRELYKIGRGPSSSHTMGPDRACRIFLEENPEAESFKVILFGSLARTGLGHCTDRAVLDVLGKERTELIFDTEPRDFAHPNTMELYAYKAGEEVAKMRVLNVGGGAIEIEGRESVEGEDIYPENS
ncbi:MAG: serine dehydratase, partial [Oscillospiraceae bacterium]|nr:serine dehydratase [Oscillospiraceae bacterium]